MGTATQTDGARSETPRAWSMTAARDRISSTLFLAALLHGIVILGVTFGTGGIDFEPATSLDVVLVLDTQTAEQAPENARVLAQSNLDGSGNTTEAVPLQTASARSADAPGPQRPGERETQRVGAMQQAPLVMTTASGSANSRTEELGEPVPRAMAQRTALPGDASQVELIDEAATQTFITDENRSRGQLAWMLRASTLVDIDCWTRVLGEPLRPSKILEAIEGNMPNGENEL